MIAYLDPQEKVWPRQSGAMFSLSELQGTDALASLDGIEGFSSSTTYYSKTLFRFPLRKQNSDISESTYTVSRLITLTNALRDEAKYLLLFLRSVQTVEVYSIASGHSQHQLHLHIQIAPQCQVELLQERASFMSKLKAKHSSCSYKISPSIPMVAQFAVNIKDIQKKYDVETITWVVANQVGSTNNDVLAAAKKQCCFPWVGVAMERGEKLALSTSSELSNGRVFCFLPMPVETSSGLPVHVNGTFGLNDDRRTIKWPSGERRNDPTARWNQMLLTECLSSCYNLLLKTSVECNHITPEQFYNAWPNVESLRHTSWQLIIQPLFKLLFQWECLWAQRCYQWVRLNQCVVTCDDYSLPEVAMRVLTAGGLKVCEIPHHVSKAVSSRVSHVSSSLVRNSLRENINAYQREDSAEKHDLLRYCLLDEDYSDLHGLELLPVADNTFKSFSTSRYANECYICRQHFSRKLLPNIDSELVDLSDIDQELHSDLLKVANSSKTQLRPLSVSTVASLLPKCYPYQWRDALTVTVTRGDCSFPYDWWKIFWKWVQEHVYDISEFEGQYLVPLVTSSNPDVMQATKLSTHSKVVVVETSEKCSPTLLNGFQKLQIQFVFLKHFHSLRHRQLFKYLNQYNPAGVLEAISNSDCQVKYVCFTTNEAVEIQRFLASQPTRRVPDSHRKILKNLQIFKVLNDSSLTSIADACSMSWRNQVILEPDSFYLSGNLLPSNLVILSRIGNQCELITSCRSSRVSMPESTMRFLIDILFQMIRSDSFPEKKIDQLMKHVLLYQFPIFRYHQELTNSLKDLPFILCSDSIRKAPSELYDSSQPLLRDIFLNMPVFPLAPFNESDLISYLRVCGLRATVSARHLFELVEKAACYHSDQPQFVSAAKLTQVKAIMLYIKKYPHILDEQVSERYVYHTMGSNMCESLKKLSKNWLPVLSTPPMSYPKSLDWKGGGYTSHFVSQNSQFVLLCKSSDVEHFAMLVGSQMYIVDCPQVLHERLHQSVPIANIFSHLYHIISKCKLFSASVLDKLVHHVYKYLNDNQFQVIDYCSVTDLSHQELIWVKKQHTFATPQQIVLTERHSFPYSLSPFFEVVSESLSDYLRLFHLFGVKNEFSDSDIVSVLRKIKFADKGVVSSYAAWKMVEHILNWLTDSGESLVEDKFADIESEGLLVPVQSHSDWPQLVNVDLVVYTDLEFLRSFESESDKDETYFIHERFAHLAAPLGIKALSTHLNVSYDAFDDVGQHEPLVTRLKNILKDYKDGLTIIKELLQNADDAGATEVTICYDARKHSVNRKSLIYKGMADCHGPALLVHNNATFTDDDFENITKLAGATKMNKPLKIGKFGVGFCSVYHITDIPSFISGGWLYIFDPTLSYLKDEIQDRARPGKKLPFTEKIVRMSKQLVAYDGLFGFEQRNKYHGTLFRFPLRTAISELSSVIYDESHVYDLLSDLQDAGSKLLLFLNNLERITFSHIKDEEAMSTLFIIEKGRITESCLKYSLSANAKLLQIHKSNTNCDDPELWLVANETEDNEEHGKPATATVACSMKRTAATYSPQNIGGEIFCYLPLSLQTGLPVHVSANFAVLNDRTGIHASDYYCPSEEVEWNLELMKSIVPKAYYSLLLAIKQLCTNNLVSLKDYEFCIFWPLKETLKSHNPWDKMIRHLYYKLTQSSLFYSACCSRWLELREAFIISNSVLSLHSTEDDCPPQCVTRVFEELSYALVKLPTSYQKHIGDSVISQRVVDEKQFLEIFFGKIDRVSLVTRNDVLFITLKVYATNSTNYLRDFLIDNNCVPCTPHGDLLKRACEVVDPCANFAELYEDFDEVFPITTFYSDGLVRKALFDLGIIHELLPWKNILERVKTIQVLYTNNPLTSLKRAACILHCIKQRILSFPFSEVPSELSDIAFLPVMNRPKKYPQQLTWFGDGKPLSNSKTLVKGESNAMLAGSQVCIVMETPPSKGGCGAISSTIAEALGVGSSPNCDSVVRHLLEIIRMFDEEEDKGKLGTWTESACEKIYKHFEVILSEDKICPSDLEELKCTKCVWTGQNFISPQSVSRSWNRNGPFLFSIPHLLVSKEKLISALGIKSDFSAEMYIETLKEIYKCHSQQPITDKKGLSTISDIANNLAETLGDDALNDYILYLPDKDGIVRPTRDLAYNDAQWCTVDDDFKFVHYEISRPTALKLGVTPVRSKALQKYESTIQEWAGVPFGQEEELTLRIHNILNDYPMDITVLKELLQNADDAGASKLFVILDKRTHKHFKIPSSEWKDLQGPALLVWNDCGFSENDLIGIQKLGLGSKRSNSETIGQYGIGFNVVYHLTDCPSFFTNGNTLCVLDPHRRYVPGASSEKPGRMYDKVGDKFWNTWCDMKSTYLRDCDVSFKCPPEIQRDKGTLFRFPLRHKTELVKKSKLVDDEHDSCKFLLSSWKMEKYLNEWAPKMKEALLFLKNVRELKFFIINDHMGTSMLVTHHFVAQLGQEAVKTCNTFFKQTKRFSDHNKDPFVDHYPLCLKETEPKRREEKWLIQQGIGDILNAEQHWEYLKQMKPQHGIAARFDNKKSDNEYNCVHKVFCFLPLPLESKLPVHINGKFVLDAGRSGLWQSRDPERPDDKQTWNQRIIEAAASSYVDFLVHCREHYISSKYYNVSSELNSDIDSYYALFPRWDVQQKPEGEMNKLAHEVYNRLLQCNSPVLVFVRKIQIEQSGPHAKQQCSYLVEWLPLINKENPSKQPYFFKAKVETKHIPPVLKKLGIQLTAAHLFLREHLPKADNDASSDDSVSTVPLATPKTVFQYYCQHYSLMNLGSHFPCSIDDTVFGSVDCFIIFLKYILQEEHLETVGGTFFSFPESPVGIPLLLTADNSLCQFTEDKHSKVICSEYASIFKNCGGQFLHPEVVKLKLLPSYFIQASTENWPIIEGIFRRVLPSSLTVKRVRNARDHINFQNYLCPLWKCLLNDKVFKVHIEGILTEWTLLATTQNELFSLKSSETILPIIPPQRMKYAAETDCKSFLTVNQSGTSESDINEEMFQIMVKCKMPILNSEVVSISLCRQFCPKLDEHHRILQNFYHLHRNGELKFMFQDPKLDSIIETLFTYFSAIHFSHKTNQVSLTRIKSLPLFKNVESTYCSLDCEAFIWPSCICSSGKNVWMKEIKETMVVFLKADGVWRKLGEASLLGINEISPLSLYRRFIFPHFHLFSEQDRMKHVLHIRDTSELFNTAWHESQAEDESERKKEGSLFLAALMQLPCLTMAGQLKPICQFYNPNIPLFSTFLQDCNFPPTTMRDSTWLNFLNKVGLRIKATEKEFLIFSQKVSTANCDDIFVASRVLLNYLFAEANWHDEDHADFLKNVSEIPFVCAENLKHLAWIVPCAHVEKIVHKGKKTFKLTSLRMAASFDNKNLVWTIKPVVKLPNLSYYHLQLSKKEREAKSELFFKHLQTCILPECEDVVRNIQNISKSRFSQFKLFETYTMECQPQKGKEGFLFEVLVECFTYLKSKHCCHSDISVMKSIPCIPVSSDGSIVDPSFPVLVPPSLVVIYNQVEVAKLVPFLNPLPVCLHSAYHRMLDILGVNSEIGFENIRFALETIHKHVKQPLDSKADMNTISVIKLLIKKLYFCLQSCTHCPGTLYLPNKNKALVESTRLLYNDKDNYKSVEFSLSGIQFSFFSLLVRKFDEIAEYKFTKRDLYNALPEPTRPLLLSLHCIEKLSSNSPPDETLTEFAKQVKTAFDFSDFAKVARIMIGSRSETFIDSCELFTQAIDRLCKSVKVFSVPDLTVDVMLKLCNPPSPIGTAKMNFFLDTCSNSESYSLYIDSGVSPFTFNFIESLTNKIISFAIEVSKVDIKHLYQPERAIGFLLKCPNTHDVKEMLHEMGVSLADIELSGRMNTDIVPKLGETIPEELHHRLKFDILNVFRPQEWVAFADREDHYIFARIEYCIKSDVKPQNELELNDYLELRRYLITISDSEDEATKEVSVVDLRKILRLREIIQNDGSSEVVLYDPESESVQLWDAISDDKLKSMMREICQELRKIWNCCDKALQRKGIKAMYLKWHPDKNPSPFATKAFQYLLRQIERHEKGLPLEDPDDGESEESYEIPHFWADAYRRWDDIAASHQESMRRETSSRSGAKSSGLDDHLNVKKDSKTAEKWLEQAECDLIALQTLLRDVDSENRVCAHVCFLAHQVAEKALKAGMYKLFGLQSSALRSHQLDILAYAIEQSQQIASGLTQLVATLKSYYVKTRYPDEYYPPSVPSSHYNPSQAREAELAARVILEVMKSIT